MDWKWLDEYSQEQIEQTISMSRTGEKLLLYFFLICIVGMMVMFCFAVWTDQHLEFALSAVLWIIGAGMSRLGAKAFQSISEEAKKRLETN